MLDKKIDKMKEFQAELDRRTQVEEQAMALIAECKFQEANELLNSLNDEAFVQMLEDEEGEVKDMPYYGICCFCGAHLDPGEHCDCQQDKEEHKEQYFDDKTNAVVFEQRKSCSSGNATA